jgi:PilZ domain-containing protein
MLDRRSEPRLMCADMVGIRWQDESGAEQDSTGLLEDISASGACLQLDSPLPLGTRIEIAYRNGRLEGSVCYCFFREIGYWVGVQFAANNKWSRRQYRPRHLLDLKKLLTKAPRPAPQKPPLQ